MSGVATKLVAELAYLMDQDWCKWPFVSRKE